MSFDAWLHLIELNIVIGVGIVIYLLKRKEAKTRKDHNV